MSSVKPSDGNKRIHWKLITTRNPKAYVIQPSKPDSAKLDLKRFVQNNQLQYRYRRPDDDIDDFENLFKQLNLNEDEDLLERADRRDLPISIQLLNRKQVTDKANKEGSSNGLVTRLKSPIVKSTHSSRRQAPVPNRRSAIPNTIYDDYAYRRFNQGTGSATSTLPKSSHRLYKYPKPALLERKHSISYMSLVTYDNFLPDRGSCECLHCDGILDHGPEDICPMKQRRKYPDLVVDDVLNRRIRQSYGAKVSAPQPPFGIPNSPVISFLHTFPETDYSRVEPDLIQLQKRPYRGREREPHLINDDMAFRSLRKDYRKGYKLDEEDYWKGQVLSRSVSTPDLSIKSLRHNLRPVRLASLTSSPDSLSPLSAASPIFDSSSFL